MTKDKYQDPVLESRIWIKVEDHGSVSRFEVRNRDQSVGLRIWIEDLN